MSAARVDLGPPIAPLCVFSVTLLNRTLSAQRKGICWEVGPRRAEGDIQPCGVTTPIARSNVERLEMEDASEENQVDEEAAGTYRSLVARTACPARER